MNRAMRIRTEIAKRTSGSFARGVATISSGSLIAQAVPVLLTPIMTRLYAPAEMGLLGLFTAFVALTSNVTSLGYAQAIVTGKTEGTADRLALLSLSLSAPMSLLLSAVFYIFVSTDTLGFGVFPWWTSPVMGLCLLLTSCFYSLRLRLLREGHYRTIAAATVGQSFGRALVQVLGGAAGLGWIGLVLGELLGRILGLRSLALQLRPILSVSRASIGGVVSVAREYQKFPRFTAPSAFVNSLALSAPVPLVTMLFGIAVAGQYSIAYRVMLLPLALIGNSIGDVFHSRIARASRDDPYSAPTLFKRTFVVLLALAFVPAVVATIWGPELFALVLGSQWRTAGDISSAIAPWMLVRFAVSPLSRLVQVYQGQELKLIYDTSSLIGVIGAAYLGHVWNWDVVETCRLLGWSQCAVYLVYLVLLWRILKQHILINSQHSETIDECRA